jgi:hypothetical protein
VAGVTTHRVTRKVSCASSQAHSTMPLNNIVQLQRQVRENFHVCTWPSVSSAVYSESYSSPLKNFLIEVLPYCARVIDASNRCGYTTVDRTICFMEGMSSMHLMSLRFMEIRKKQHEHLDKFLSGEEYDSGIVSTRGTETLFTLKDLRGRSCFCDAFCKKHSDDPRAPSPGSTSYEGTRRTGGSGGVGNCCCLA